MAHVKNLDLKKVPPVDYSRARMSVDRALDALRRMDQMLYRAGLEGMRDIIWPGLADARLQLDAIRRYLDGE